MTTEQETYRSPSITSDAPTQEHRQFVDDIHPTLTCRRRLPHSRKICGQPLVWHERIKRYWLCTNKDCLNFCVCSCGGVYGKHYHDNYEPQAPKFAHEGQ